MSGEVRFILFVCCGQLAVEGSYSLSQLCIKRGNIEFLKSLVSESVTVSVEGSDFSVSLTPVHREYSSLCCLLCTCEEDSLENRDCFSVIS